MPPAWAGDNDEILRDGLKRRGDDRLASVRGRAGKEPLPLLDLVAELRIVPQRLAALDDGNAAGGVGAVREPFEGAAAIDVPGILLLGHADFKRSVVHKQRHAVAEGADANQHTEVTAVQNKD